MPPHEQGVWFAQSGGNYSPIVEVILDGNAATLRGVHVDKLTVILKEESGPFALLHERGVLD
jgi:hypothetical protein